MIEVLSVLGVALAVVVSVVGLLAVGMCLGLVGIVERAWVLTKLWT